MPGEEPAVEIIDLREAPGERHGAGKNRPSGTLSRTRVKDNLRAFAHDLQERSLFESLLGCVFGPVKRKVDRTGYVTLFPPLRVGRENERHP